MINNTTHFLIQKYRKFNWDFRLVVTVLGNIEVQIIEVLLYLVTKSVFSPHDNSFE